MVQLQDEFPEAYRFATSVFPSEDDDVITSPYNALLSLAELTEHADAVFPLENQALMDMCSLIQTRSGPSASQPASLLSGPNTGTMCCRHALVADAFIAAVLLPMHWLLMGHISLGLSLPVDVAFCVTMLMCTCIIYSVYFGMLQVVIYMQHLQHAASEP